MKLWLVAKLALGSSLKHRGLRKVIVLNRHSVLFHFPESQGVILNAPVDMRQEPATIDRRLGQN